MDDERQAKLKTSMERNGCVQPLVVRKHPDKSGHYILVDGHYRHTILKQLKVKGAQCVVVDVDDTQAGVLLATLNRLRGEDHPRKRAALLEGLLPHYTPTDLAAMLPETEAQIQDLLALLKAEEADIQAQLQAHIDAEVSSLPETLTFVLTHNEATQVRAALTHYDADNVNRALVLLCQSMNATGDDDGDTA
jgi:ParB/RepB/Spo0J family partition protein